MNLAYVAAHGTAWGAPYPINWGSINDAFGNTGGSGATLGLIIATFIVGKRIRHNIKFVKCHLHQVYLISMNQLSLVYH